MAIEGVLFFTALLFGLVTYLFFMFFCYEKEEPVKRSYSIIVFIGFAITFLCVLSAIWASLDVTL